jgi:hypothetical protein
MTLSRVQILDYIENAFGDGPVTTEQIGEAAARNGADPAVLFLLRQLPSRQFASPRDLWPYLPDLPVGV